MDTSTFYPSALALCSLVTAGYLLFLAICGLFLNLRSRSNQSFLLMCLYAFVWHLGTGFMLASRDPELAEKWYRFAYVGVVFIGPGIYFFTSALTDRVKRNRREIIAAHLTAGLFALEGFIGEAAIEGVWEYSWGFYPRYGSLGLLLIALFVRPHCRELPHPSDRSSRNRISIEKATDQGRLLRISRSDPGSTRFRSRFRGFDLHVRVLLHCVVREHHVLVDLSLSAHEPEPRVPGQEGVRHHCRRYHDRGRGRVHPHGQPEGGEAARIQ